MNSLKLKLFIVAAAVLGGSQAFAQNVQLGPEWGEDADAGAALRKRQDLNYYRDAYNVQNYDKALSYLPELLENSPPRRTEYLCVCHQYL